MSYRSGRCCCDGSRGGLGQSPQDVEAGRRILVGMIQRESGRIAGYADTPAVAAIRKKISEAVTWARAAAWRAQEGKLADAMESVNVGIRFMHEASRATTSLTAADIRAAQAQTQTQTGASFGDQLLATLGIKTDVYQPDVPGGPVADVVGGAVGGTARAVGGAALASYPWLIPAAAGVVLFLATRK